MVSPEDLERYGIKPGYARWYTWLRASREIVDLYNSIIKMIGDVINRIKREEFVATDEELLPFFERQRPLLESYKVLLEKIRAPFPTRWSMVRYVPINPLDIARVDKRTWNVIDDTAILTAEHSFDDALEIIKIRFDEKDELIKRLKKRYYRYMHVRNFTSTEETGYPFLAEIRATYITTKPVDIITTDMGKKIKIMDALRITTQNILYYFFKARKKDGSLGGSTLIHAERLGKVKQTEGKVSIGFFDEIVETEGTEEGKEISAGEITGFPLDYAIKYVRVVNEHSIRAKKMFIYLNERIEEELRKAGCIIDSKGFVWKPRKI